MGQFCASALLAALCVQAPTMEELVGRLSSDSLVAREKAQAEIQNQWKSWTAGDLAALEKAGGSKIAETAIRAKAALDRIQLCRRIPGEVAKQIPDVATLLLEADSGKLAGLIDALWAKQREQTLAARHIMPVLVKLMQDARIPGFLPDEESPFNSDRRTVGDLACELADELIPALASLNSAAEREAWWKENKGKPERDWHLPLLDDASESVRVRGFLRLCMLKDATLNSKLIEFLKNFTDEKMFGIAVGGLPVDVSIPVLKAWLADRRPLARLAVAKLFFADSKREAVDAVIEALEHPERMAYDPAKSEGVLNQLLYWLASTCEDRAIDFVVKCLRAGSTDVKFTAIGALARIKDPRVDEGLVRAFDDPDRKSGWTCGSIRQPRMCDWAGFALTQRMKIDSDFTWPESHRDRDKNLEEIRNRWREGKGLPPIPFLGPGVEAVSPEKLGSVDGLPSVRRLSELGPGAWAPLKDLISKTAPAEKARLEKVARGLSNSLRRVTAKSDEAAAYAAALSKRLHEPFDPERFIKDVPLAWFDDPKLDHLHVAISRGQDGRGVSVDLQARGHRLSEYSGFSLVNVGRISKFAWKRDLFVARLELEFADLKAALDGGPDIHAEVDIWFVKTPKP